MNKNIGVFDSGLGGLTILKNIVQILPQYHYVYFGDNARTPYGNKSFEAIYEYTLQGINFLFDTMDCELIIIACNTASAKVLRTIQQKDLIKKWGTQKRVLGIIRPTTECIDIFTQTKEIGILATQGTVESLSYNIEIKKFFPHIKVFSQACPEWVGLVERNEFNKIENQKIIAQPLKQILDMNTKIDTLVLACTHYPFLIPVIKKLISPHVKIISQGELIAESLKQYLSKHIILNSCLQKNGRCDYYTTGSVEIFDNMATHFLGTPITSQYVK